jgi:hypothetical protein
MSSFKRVESSKLLKCLNSCIPPGVTNVQIRPLFDLTIFQFFSTQSDRAYHNKRIGDSAAHQCPVFEKRSEDMSAFDPRWTYGLPTKREHDVQDQTGELMRELFSWSTVQSSRSRRSREASKGASSADEARSRSQRPNSSSSQLLLQLG